MFKKIRTSKFSKVVASYLVLMLFLEMTQPMVMFALTEGPSQPEFNSFTPIGTSDMVDLTSGDFNYNIPIMDVGGYPINLAYNSGVTMDQEASWVGLGWNLNIGQINRNVRGIPDDFKGDEIETQNNLKPNVTVSITPYINPQVWGFFDSTYGNSSAINIGAGLEVKYNNYTGLSANPTMGVSFNLSKNVSLGLQLSTSDEMGASISPSVSLNTTSNKKAGQYNRLNGKLTGGITYNSRQGLQNFNLSSSLTRKSFVTEKQHDVTATGGGSISFINNTFTPTKRIAFDNNQFTFSFSSGPSFWGIQAELSISASATIQTLKDKFNKEKAFGYENTELATSSDLLDFNRENELGTVTKSTNILPVTNYTYDILSIQSQGLNGQIRPYRGQAGYVFDSYVSDQSTSTSLSGEFEGGFGLHFGASIKYSSSTNYTSPWETIATPYLKDKLPSNIKYEKVYYKNVGEQRVDPEYHRLLEQNFGGDSPITLTLSDKNALNKFSRKTMDGYTSNLTTMPSFTTSNLRRDNREERSKVIQKITKKEAADYGLTGKFIENNPNALDHHNAGFLVTDENGNKNIFGETAYNLEKSEVTFATNSNRVDCSRGIVDYDSLDNSMDNSAGIDHYFNSVKTKQYAHTYLISSVLSSDYQDLDNNGPSDNDLGTYTKFTYTSQNDLAYSNNYKWRVPYGLMKASYNEGFKTDKKDQKGSYLYGVKEIKYVKRIETKTHVALIDFDERLDGYGVTDKNGGLNTSNKTYCIKSIRLYVKSPGQEIPSDLSPSSDIKPIKTAHFEYDYSMCPDIDNNSGVIQLVKDVNINANKGKLTLKKVYFTYQNSNMGKYTPYVFVYGNNKPYNPKNYDIWGNYKENPNTEGNCQELSPQDFPFVDQSNRDAQNGNATAWSLEEIKLPSGGKIKVTLESDDYQYVQNKKAMQMFKVLGVTDDVDDEDSIRSSLYYTSGGYDAEYVAIQVDHPAATNSETIRRYTEGLKGKPIYFDFFLNMTSSKNDHVTGYFEMNDALNRPAVIRNFSGHQCLMIPMKKTSREGSSGVSTNPISVAGWFFGRQNLHRQIYDLPEPSDGIPNPLDLAISIKNSLEPLIEIFIGPNGRLKELGCARTFDPEKSWIRLYEPTGSKLGGGSRVRKVEMFDNWETMLNQQDIAGDLQRYKKKYGQEYSYELENNTSSGVATFEPNMSKENPFVEPFYNGREKLSAQTYEEKPFGTSFFPSPVVTYSRVAVKNITAADDDGVNNPDLENRKTKSGKVVTHHYTSYDFPTKTDFTNLAKSKVSYSNEEVVLPNLLLGMFGLNIPLKDELIMTQGFQIETNDMNGKVKKQEVFDNNNNLISYTENIYSTNSGDPSTLNNFVKVIDKNGNVSDKAIGVEYDVVNDLRYNYNYSSTVGVNGNLEIIPLFFYVLVVGTAFFDNESHTQTMRAAVTTKVIHKTGILKEKRAFDLGSLVTTNNLAWDAKSGQVILTQTGNEYDDNYYSFNQPAYWYYEKMGMASENVDIRGVLKIGTGNPNGGIYKMDGVTDLNTIFKVGDELLTATIFPNASQPIEIEDTDYIPPSYSDTIGTRLWVVGFRNNGQVVLMDRNGRFIDPCKIIDEFNFRIIHSGNRNQQMAFMASITSIVNPIDADGNGITDIKLANFVTNTSTDFKIINASAIVYNDYWKPEIDSAPFYPDYKPYTGLYDPNKIYPDGAVRYPNTYNVNPYLYNIKGNWRAEKSYAFLTSRKAVNITGGAAYSNPRKNGFYLFFNSFYTFNEVDNKWIKNVNNWTSASEVTKYSPNGFELENKDALNRYSSAQYGYLNTLPMAVASNSSYQEMGFEGFEEGGSGNRMHFGFLSGNASNIETSTDYSHTGKKSVKVLPGNNVQISRLLVKQNQKWSTWSTNCSGPADPDSGHPGCGYNVTLSYSEENGYSFSFPVNFGPDGPGGDVTFCNTDHEGYTYSGGTISYLSPILHSAMVSICDPQGQCNLLSIIPYGNNGDHVQIHCSSNSSCNGEN